MSYNCDTCYDTGTVPFHGDCDNCETGIRRKIDAAYKRKVDEYRQRKFEAEAATGWSEAFRKELERQRKVEAEAAAGWSDTHLVVYSPDELLVRDHALRHWSAIDRLAIALRALS